MDLSHSSMLMSVSELEKIHHPHTRMARLSSSLLHSPTAAGGMVCDYHPDAPCSCSYKQCRRASETDSTATRPQQQHHIGYSPSLLSRSNSLLSDGRLGLPSCSPTNSSANSDDNGNASEQSSRLIRNESLFSSAYGGTAARTDTCSHQTRNSQPAGLGVETTAESHREGFRGILAGLRSPFTGSQWQELEQQALIFKYMMAGVPVPSDLLIAIRESAAALSFVLSAGPYQPRMAWSSSQLGFVSANTDPEPGRCRRTDGKKWRCARDVVSDQKYCERHMHRGRHRSRKPVETHTPAAPSHSDPVPSSSNINIHARTPSSSSCSSFSFSLARDSTTTAGVSKMCPSFAINPPNHNTNHQHQCQSPLPISSNLLLQMASGSTSTMGSNKEYRCVNGMRGDQDRQIFFSEMPGSTGELSQDSVLSSVNNNGWRSNMPSKLLQIKTEQNEPLVQGNSPQIRTRLLSHDLGPMSDTNQIQTQHSLSNSGLGVAVEYCNGVPEGHGQPLRHFFDDWPRPRNASWSDVEEDRSNRSSSTTQLSISIPMALSGFSATNSSSHRGGGGSGAVCTRKLSQ